MFSSPTPEARRNPGISEAIATDLLRHDLEAEAVDVERLSGIDGHDSVVMGSAVYAGHWLKPAREFAFAHAAALRERPV